MLLNMYYSYEYTIYKISATKMYNLGEMWGFRWNWADEKLNGPLRIRSDGGSLLNKWAEGRVAERGGGGRGCGSGAERKENTYCDGRCDIIEIVPK